MVADMVDDSGSWDWNRISQRLLQDMLEKIDVVKPSQYGLGTDNPSWQWEENRSFSTQSTYKALDDTMNLDINPYWKKI
ncbi:hypothetical protein V6N12_073384 [Hibiscus sabdariffa]|uniref:Uncharacterized protein n=1 Tax=Hibiscus sabdariffa TaxID=183260 RepID=A0ABR2BT67_9ROSI